MRLSQSNPFHPFLHTLVITVLLLLLLIAGFNRLIDPFGLFERPRIEGLNSNKTEFGKHMRMAKAAAVRRIKPKAIVLGSSRGLIGIDPQHPGWSSRPVYNLALPSSNIYEAFRYLQHANALATQKQVVLMLDLFMFNSYANPDKSDFDEQRLAVSVKGIPQSTNKDMLAALVSLDSFQNSLQTVRKQHAIGVILFGLDGFAQMDAALILEGKRALFRQVERDHAGKQWGRFSFCSHSRDNWTIYRQLLQLAHRNGIDLRIAISPSHARMFETIAAKGIWPLFEDWKRMLVRINEEKASQLDKTPFPIWDFSGYNSLTTEPVPPFDDTISEMKWFWEASHYKKELGDLVLDRIFRYQEQGRLVPDDFGVRLTSNNINPHLEHIRADRQQWRISFPEDTAEIDALRTDQQKGKSSNAPTQ